MVNNLQIPILALLTILIVISDLQILPQHDLLTRVNHQAHQDLILVRQIKIVQIDLQIVTIVVLLITIVLVISNRLARDHLIIRTIIDPLIVVRDLPIPIRTTISHQEQVEVVHTIAVQDLLVIEVLIAVLQAVLQIVAVIHHHPIAVPLLVAQEAVVRQVQEVVHIVEDS